MNTTLSKIKKGETYTFNVYYDGGSGSGSQSWSDVRGEVKEINEQFIRVIPVENLKAGNKRSVKVYNSSIIKVSL